MTSLLNAIRIISRPVSSETPRQRGTRPSDSSPGRQPSASSCSGSALSSCSANRTVCGRSGDRPSGPRAAGPGTGGAGLAHRPPSSRCRRSCRETETRRGFRYPRSVSCKPVSCGAAHCHVPACTGSAALALRRRGLALPDRGRCRPPSPFALPWRLLERMPGRFSCSTGKRRCSRSSRGTGKAGRSALHRRRDRMGPGAGPPACRAGWRRHSHDQARRPRATHRAARGASRSQQVTRTSRALRAT